MERRKENHRDTEITEKKVLVREEEKITPKHISV